VPRAHYVISLNAIHLHTALLSPLTDRAATSHAALVILAYYNTVYIFVLAAARVELLLLILVDHRSTFS
jgi:hypothetical protein